jgi:hypothetical protein
VNFDNYADEIGIDKDNDYYNADHMNIFGNEKFTRYFGQYIVDHYDISTDHDKETIERWNDCAEYTANAFEVLKQRTLSNEDILYTEFTDLSEENHKKLIKKKHKDDLKRDEEAKKLAEENKKKSNKKPKKILQTTAKAGNS